MREIQVPFAGVSKARGQTWLLLFCKVVADTYLQGLFVPTVAPHQSPWTSKQASQTSRKTRTSFELVRSTLTQHKVCSDPN